MSTVLETRRLIVRQWMATDAEAVLALCGDGEVMRYVGTGEPYRCIEQAQSFVARAEAHEREHGYSRWAVIEKASGRAVGSCGLACVAGGEVELGYLFERASWGKGYATEAASACMAYAFARLGLERLVAWTAPEHEVTHRVLEKVGFRRVGTQRHDGEAVLVFEAVHPQSESRAGEAQPN